MKKLLLPALVLGLFTFSSCGGSSEEASGYEGDGTLANDAEAVCRCYSDIESGKSSELECDVYKSAASINHGEAFAEALNGCDGGE